MQLNDLQGSNQPESLDILQVKKIEANIVEEFLDKRSDVENVNWPLPKI